MAVRTIRLAGGSDVLVGGAGSGVCRGVSVCACDSNRGSALMVLEPEEALALAAALMAASAVASAERLRAATGRAA